MIRLSGRRLICDVCESVSEEEREEVTLMNKMKWGMIDNIEK